MIIISNNGINVEGSKAIGLLISKLNNLSQLIINLRLQNFDLIKLI